ncbi:MAG TPA: hypothetical protein VFV92_10225, partial [Candidatus Bathyarchaeia archaeon]|nr:hypothetical protein [Candidatus Bathyarchaeia archaeon]
PTPPSPLVVCASKVYPGLGADIVYGIITLTNRHYTNQPFATRRRRRRLSLLPWSNDTWDMKSYRWNRLGPLEADLL